MNREEFINALNEKIQNDPDHNEIVSYYYELINDKIDSGMTEEEAIESLGDLDSIVKNIEESKSELSITSPILLEMESAIRGIVSSIISLISYLEIVCLIIVIFAGGDGCGSGLG